MPPTQQEKSFQAGFQDLFGLTTDELLGWAPDSSLHTTLRSPSPTFKMQVGEGSLQRSSSSSEEEPSEELDSLDDSQLMDYDHENQQQLFPEDSGRGEFRYDNAGRDVADSSADGEADHDKPNESKAAALPEALSTLQELDASSSVDHNEVKPAGATTSSTTTQSLWKRLLAKHNESLAMVTSFKREDVKKEGKRGSAGVWRLKISKLRFGPEIYADAVGDHLDPFFVVSSGVRRWHSSHGRACARKPDKVRA